MKINCSFYDEKSAPNKMVAMFSAEVCPNCKGKRITGKIKEEIDIDARSILEVPEACPRCHGDGWLTNPIKFIPEAMTCASNMFPLGTWLIISKFISGCLQEDCEFWIKKTSNLYGCLKHEMSRNCPYEDKIIVMVTDRMASWLNSENGLYTHVCKNCKQKSYNPKIIACSKCGQEQILIRDIDLSKGAFLKLAPLDKGVIECDIEIL